MTLKPTPQLWKCMWCDRVVVDRCVTAEQSAVCEEPEAPQPPNTALAERSVSYSGHTKPDAAPQAQGMPEEPDTSSMGATEAYSAWMSYARQCRAYAKRLEAELEQVREALRVALGESHQKPMPELRDIAARKENP